MKSVLHIVSKSSGGNEAITSCLRLANPGSTILLTEDGVSHAQADSDQAKAMTRRMKDCSFFVLGPDLASRGLEESILAAGIRTIGYDGFVDLVATHEVTQSWF